MAEVKCDYCGNIISDADETCPNCGAPNASYARFTTKKQRPTTIAELESWYKAMNLPPYETTRFFIGIDYKAPKAFGIYKDGDDFVVYKNKASGERAIRYRGKDEDYAVNELYLKLKEEILNQKNLNKARRAGQYRQKPPLKESLMNIFWVVLIGAFIFFFIGSPWYAKIAFGLLAAAVIEGITQEGKKKVLIPAVLGLAAVLIFAIPFYHGGIQSFHDGAYYTSTLDDLYYRQGSDWYFYDTYYDTWVSSDEPANVSYVDTMPENFTGMDFENSDWYDSNVRISEFSMDNAKSEFGDRFAENMEGGDSDSSWDSNDSWDSGGSDWDSDW